LRENVSPLCTALRENIGHSIQAVLANDQAIIATRPLLVAMSKSYMSSSVVSQNGWGNLHTVRTIDHDTSAMDLDMERLERIIGAMTHNLQLVEQQLNDPNRFPKIAKTDADRKALELKAQLEQVAAQQKQTLNVLDGLLDTRNMDELANRGDPAAQLFGLNDSNNPKVSGSNQEFSGGPLSQTPDQQYDPSLKPEEFSSLSNSIFGRFYYVVFLEQHAIDSLEQPLAKNIVEVTQRCSGTPSP
jgi:hypothetical protein